MSGIGRRGLLGTLLRGAAGISAVAASQPQTNIAPPPMGGYPGKVSIADRVIGRRRLSQERWAAGGLYLEDQWLPENIRALKSVSRVAKVKMVRDHEMSRLPFLEALWRKWEGLSEW